MTHEEIRQTFIDFFKARNHAEIPSASLVPENDPSVLFVTAGMQPLVPFLLGQSHPAGRRLVNVQKCVRTQDIEEVGDATHDTFFEMLGNWSLGDPDSEDGVGEQAYWKETAIKWSYELLTSSEEGFGLDPERLYVTIFAGNNDAPFDQEAEDIWISLGIPEHRIYRRNQDNWWSPGDNGPCGPSSEMFYDLTEEGLGNLTSREFDEADDNQQVVEIWNDVFMEYEKEKGEVVGKLKQKNVDTGAGLERLAMVLQRKNNIFATDLFAPLMLEIQQQAEGHEVRSARIIADHVRTAYFMITDGVKPSNTDRGYVLRRLIRRAIRHADKIQLNVALSELASIIPQIYDRRYTLSKIENKVIQVINTEEDKFRQTLKRGLGEFKKIEGDISGQEAFDLYQSYGFPLELTKELAEEEERLVDEAGFQKAMKEHQEKSRQSAQDKFKGGLADTSNISIKYHTATHLLHAALREILGDHVEQRGSNITPKRLRFDFSHPKALTDEEKSQVENWVNDKITKNIPVRCDIMSKKKAENLGAIGLFTEQYGDEVSVYTIGDEEVVSREFCGGPHVESTGDLGNFKITKEKSSSKGVRRIKAILED